MTSIEVGEAAARPVTLDAPKTSPGMKRSSSTFTL